MEIKILGISGSPIKGGNTEAFLSEALRAAGEIEGVSTEMISLAGKNIDGCRHCNWCITKQEEGRVCNLYDDMQEIYPKLLEADAFLIATPTYFTRLSGYTAIFIDRLRSVFMGGHYRGSLTNKVMGAMTVLWWRNFGAETALLSIISAFMAANMIVVGSKEGVCQFGAVGLSSEHGTGKFDPEDKLGVLKDEKGIKSAHILARRVVEVSRMLKAGKEALKEA